MPRTNVLAPRRGAVMIAALVSLCVWMPQRVVAQQQSLAGSTWKLTSLTMSGQTTTPDDAMKYTLTFQKDGQVAVRADCNRGRGPYTDPPDSLDIGPITLTKARCAPGSLADQFARALGFVQSYEVRDGTLLLGIAPGGDTLRFEPSPTKGK